MIPFDIPGIFDSDTIGGIDYIPTCLVVQGGGIVGLEYAHMFAKLGSRVIVIEFFDKIVQMLDVDVQETLLNELASSNVEILLKTGIKTVEAIDGSASGQTGLRIDTGDRIIECDCLLSATGRSGFTEGLALENIGLTTGRGKMIPVDDNQYTGIGNIYAVGDVVAGNLATVGQAQAARAVRRIFGCDALASKEVKPFVVWSIPEIAWAGLTEQAAKEQNINVGTVCTQCGGTLRGIVSGERGYLKLVYSQEDGKVLGVHIVGNGSCEMINYGAELLNEGGTVHDVLRFVFPAVTYHTAYNEAAAEATLRLSGVKNLSAATAWLRIKHAIQTSLDQSASTMTLEEALRAAFSAFDLDGSGLLSADELRKSIQSFALNLEDTEIEDMITEIGADGSRLIDYSEWVKTYHVPVLEQQVRKNLTVPGICFQTDVSHYDLLVLGAGPAGMKAAVDAASRGYRVGIIEPKASLTGAPTGAHSKCVREAVMQGKRSWPEVKTVISQMQTSAQEMTARLLRTFHVDVLKGSGAFVNTSTVRYTPAEGTSQDLTASAIIIATGSRANRLPMIPFDIPGIFDSDTIGGIDYIPTCLVVQGGGIVGLEYAHMFAKLGSRVIVIEFFDKIVQMLDVDVQETLLNELASSNVEILLKTGIKTVEAIDGSASGQTGLRIDTGDRIIECDCLLSATGRSGFTEGLALENIGLTTGRGKMIPVDDNQYTGIGNIYAVGDVVAGNLATVGQAQAARAVRRIFGCDALASKEVKPFVVWSIPEIAWAGLTEQAAKEQNINVGTVCTQCGGTLRGIVSGERGYLKLVYSQEDGKVLGVHIVGNGSCEMINYGAELLNEGGTVHDVLRFVFPAVTYHTAYNEAAAEATLRLSGVKNLSAATAWLRIKHAIQTSLDQSASTMTLEEALRAAFSAFDLDGSGLLSADELRKSIQSFALNLEDTEVEDMIAEVDVNRSRYVDYSEFVHACRLGDKVA
eukprot:TRINITY_DN22553_c0_g1_i1.p1 TRINITY_DN22553_c0_g1~~TRINITY_DN22553_c0_g1_i1.p1  ORF type:complete len:975 (-),score=177.41 TRINITY_DN22553_c0_g1_i1:28-2952(-)